MPDKSARNIVCEALAHHQAGRLGVAEALYRQALQADPVNADALHLLGVLAHQAGHHEAALSLIDKAVEVNARVPDFHSNRGTVCSALGYWAEAADAFQRTVDLQPDFSNACFNLGVALQHLGRMEEAVASYRRAARLKDDPGVFNNLGLALQSLGRIPEAIGAFREALRLCPSNADAAWNHAYALKESGDVNAACAAFTRLLAIHPARSEIHFQLGLLEQQRENLAFAESHYRRSLGFERHPQAANNLALLLENRDELDNAEALYRVALEAKPNYCDAWNNLGNVLLSQLRVTEAVLAYEQAIATNPSGPDAYYNRALALLTQGDNRRGWEAYESRWKWPGFGTALPVFRQPWWRGEEIAGKSILLWGEQGIGDTIHFVRYATLVAERGARVTLAVPVELRSLMRDMPGVERILGDGESIHEFDFHSPLLSLPHVFGTTLETVPARMPALPLPPVEEFPVPFAPDGQLKVGIIWGGGTKYKKDRLRSVTLKHFHSLLGLPGISFYSFQAGPRTAELVNLPEEVTLHDVGGRVRDFRDTASAMRQMDLVISTCTSSLHLAGGLGIPTWALLSHAPCWRWMLRREDSPWYPTMRLFRQQKPGDWDGVFARVEAELAELRDASNRATTEACPATV